ncbi:hypothetical protein ACHAWF_002822 [Thalassiosira exigua]
MAKQLSSCLSKYINVYTPCGGYTIKLVLMDQECDKMDALIPQIECNNAAAREHVSNIERQHCTIKECTCTVHSSLLLT